MKENKSVDNLIKIPSKIRSELKREVLRFSNKNDWNKIEERLNNFTDTEKAIKFMKECSNFMKNNDAGTLLSENIK